jgi:hypothetical protein
MSQPDTPIQQEWSEPQPRTLPRPTSAPFLLAIGTAMGFWGIVTSPIMSLGGVALFVGALVMWMNELRREAGDSHD